jgi:VCBS repeat-containing protein
LTAGVRNLTAVYTGDQNFVGSTSTSVGQTVNPANTQLTIASDNPDPSQPGEAVTVKWNLQVTGGGAGTPSGTVTVSGGAGVTCTVTATFGTSSCSLTFPSGGSKTITVDYPGDANFVGSSDTKSHLVNTPPSAADDGYSMLEDDTLKVSLGNGVLKNDDDPDNGPSGLTARNFSQPAHGTLSPSLNNDGSFTYTPDADFNGTDTFTYQAFDGAASAQATVTITIGPVNDAPSFTLPQDDSLVVSAAGGTFGQPWANGSPGPSNENGQTLLYTVSVDPFGSALFTPDGQPSIAPNGFLTFTPQGTFMGVAHVTVHVQDSGGTQNGGVDTSGDQTFPITINQ